MTIAISSNWPIAIKRIALSRRIRRFIDRVMQADLAIVHRLLGSGSRRNALDRQRRPPL
jgi:hypothetical protein